MPNGLRMVFYCKVNPGVGGCANLDLPTYTASGAGSLPSDYIFIHYPYYSTDKTSPSTCSAYVTFPWLSIFCLAWYLRGQVLYGSGHGGFSFYAPADCLRAQCPDSTKMLPVHQNIPFRERPNKRTNEHKYC
jgi:hypothetical protein